MLLAEVNEGTGASHLDLYESLLQDEGFLSSVTLRALFYAQLGLNSLHITGQDHSFQNDQKTIQA